MGTYNWTQVPMPDRDAKERTRTFDEVALGYSYQLAKEEADRCLQCKHPACEEGCPNHNPIRDFIRLVREDRIMEAAELDWSQNAIPSCTGRVCAWEKQCEGACPMSIKGETIKIGAIERFLSDYALAHLDQVQPEKWVRRSLSQKVAVIGAGPAGLTVGHFLSQEGYQVTVFDKWIVPGGVMAYGIPEYVLPNEVILQEVSRLTRQGVRFEMGVDIGKDITIADLKKQGYEAIFLGLGANKATGVGVPGEDLAGVMSAKDFLMRVAADVTANYPSHEKPNTIDVGNRVIVIGAGNTAMDAARTAIRLGAKEVKIVYRRTEAESPSRPIEIHHAKAEGVEFEYLVNPVRFVGDESGRVTGAELVRMRLGAPDKSGRPRPEPIPGSEFIMPIDTAISAVGYSPERELTDQMEGLQLDKWGSVVADPKTGATSLEGIFAGGDIVTGANTVVHAVAAGRKAAETIQHYLEERARASA
ncbi:MAG: NAD(P)-dependent oxidoreductase [Symbiobacteriia bacterium]